MKLQKILQAVLISSLTALIILGIVWELWLAPLRSGGSLLVLKVVPLLLVWRGALRLDVYTLQWSSMLILLYFTEGIVRATSEHGTSSILGWTEVALTLIYFVAALLYLRPIKRQAKQAKAVHHA